MVTLTPDFSFSLLVATRKASSSVMSASSWLVTAGIITALRNKLAPLIFWMRPNSLRSMGPNLAKSTLGQGIKPRPAPSPAGALLDCACVRVSPAMTARLKACTSSCEMRPLGPLPLTSFKGTPNSRANLRTEGEAWGRSASLRGPSALGNPVDCFASLAMTGVAMTGGVTASPEGAAVSGCFAAVADCFASLAMASVSRTKITEPCLTLSPNFTDREVTTPACDEGISIEALSDSTVIKDCSARTLSPTFTSSSMTATSSKSPISGTFTSIVAMCFLPRIKREAD